VKKREPEYSRELVREIREANPVYSAKKIHPILLAAVPRVATQGRLIT
jgi:hypothetical protein